MSAAKKCGWREGRRWCGNRATHEWHITAGCMSGWQPRCDEHRVYPSVPGEMLSGCQRLVREVSP